MSIPNPFRPVCGVPGGVLPPGFPLREHIITGRVNGKTLGLGEGEPQPESWGQYMTRYNGVEIGFGFAAAVLISGENEPGTTLAFSARKSGEPLHQLNITSTGVIIWTDAGTFGIDSSAGFAGVNMQSHQGYDELSKELINVPRTGEPVIGTSSYLAVPTYSHGLLFDRELTEAEFAEVVSALRAIAN